MSETETTPTQPRRSQRDRKQTQRLDSDSRKRKRDEDTDNTDAEDVEDVEDVDEDEAYVKPKTKAKASPRKSQSESPPETQEDTERETTRQEAVDVTNLTKDTSINDDNALFNAILSPTTALQSTTEDFLSSFSTSPQLALSELITCFLRCCGCNEVITSDEVGDLDGVVDRLDDVVEGMRVGAAPTYPLVSKLPLFKHFPKSLTEFLTRLISSSSESDALTSSDSLLIPTIQAWITPMSSSVLRSFRHTATVIALEIQGGLCEVARGVEGEVDLITRQKAAEKKKSGKGGNKKVEAELEKRMKESKEKRRVLSEYITEFFDSVFIHRYRDLDPSIRSACVTSLGTWLLTHPSTFLDSSYLRYIGWVLSDPSPTVRLSALKALKGVYSKRGYAVSLQGFTERFKGRLVEIARRDTDISVRVSAVLLLGEETVEEALEEEQRESVCLMVFDEEARVRRGVGGFVRGVWEEGVEEAMVGAENTEETKERVGIKVLAGLLVKWMNALDRREDGEDGRSESSDGMPVSPATNATMASRIRVVVDALWDAIPCISAWEPLLADLLLDHSSSSSSSGKKKGKAKKGRKDKDAEKDAEGEEVQDVWRLEDVEEGVMLEVLVAALQHTVSPKKGKEEDATTKDTLTRALIKSLPRLISKHQTDERRIGEVVCIPRVMNLDMYLEMRVVTAYEGLWDDIIKQFLTHSSPVTLHHCLETIMAFMDTTTLSATNTAKMLELEEALSSTLRDAILPASEMGLEIGTFNEDETKTLSACVARVSELIKGRDLSGWMEEEEGGKQSALWSVFSAILERGSLGYEGEEKMVVDALDVLTMTVIWKYASKGKETDEGLAEKRDMLLERLTEYAVGSSGNVCEEVKRAAFQHVLSLYALFRIPAGEEETGLEMPEEMQFRFAGFVQSEIERYADELSEIRGEDKGSDEESDEEEAETQMQKGKKGKKGGKSQTETQETQGTEQETQTLEKHVTHAQARVPNRTLLEREYTMNAIVSSFIRAIRVRVIGVRHTGIILAHYGRLDPMFDTCVKTVVDILREEGMLNNKGEVVISVALQALRESFALFLDRVESDETHTFALAKLLGSCFFIRGAQLTIVRRLETSYLVHLHTSSISWIVKKIAGYHAVGDTRLRNRAISFFRVLVPLAVQMDSKDLMQIKAHLDQALATAKLEVGSAKAWDAYRAYDKKLTPGASKAKGTRKAKSKKLVNGDGLSEDELAGGASASENEDLQPPPSQRKRTRPAPRPKKYPESSQEEDNDDGDGDVDMDEAAPASQTTPRAKRVTATYSKSKEASSSPSKRNGIFQVASQQEVEAALEVEDAASHEADQEGDDTQMDIVPPPAAPVHKGRVPDPDVPNNKSKRRRMLN